MFVDDVWACANTATNRTFTLSSSPLLFHWQQLFHCFSPNCPSPLSEVWTQTRKRRMQTKIKCTNIKMRVEKEADGLTLQVNISFQKLSSFYGNILCSWEWKCSKNETKVWGTTTSVRLTGLKSSLSSRNCETVKSRQHLRTHLNLSAADSPASFIHSASSSSSLIHPPPHLFFYPHTWLPSQVWRSVCASTS